MSSVPLWFASSSARFLSEGRVAGEEFDFGVDLGALAGEEGLDRVAQAGVANPVRAVGALGQIAAGDLVRPLGARLDAPQAALDGELDRPVIAQLEVQEAVVLGAAPVAAEQRVLPQHVEGAGDGAAVA